MLKKSDKKVWKAIEATQKFVDDCKKLNVAKTFTMGNDIGFTPYWCECRNLEKYKEMLGQDKRKLRPELKELYQAI